MDRLAITLFFESLTFNMLWLLKLFVFKSGANRSRAVFLPFLQNIWIEEKLRPILCQLKTSKTAVQKFVKSTCGVLAVFQLQQSKSNQRLHLIGKETKATLRWPFMHVQFGLCMSQRMLLTLHASNEKAWVCNALVALFLVFIQWFASQCSNPGRKF